MFSESKRAADSAVLRVPKTAELIAERLRGQIIRGELTEGDALPNETELVEKFGVSRPTLREALRVLESESLLDITRGMRGGGGGGMPPADNAAPQFGWGYMV